MDKRLTPFLAEDGSIRQMPAKHTTRQVLLDHVAQSFPIGERFPEAEVNARLHAYDADHAALRRYLVEGEFLSRGGGFYWRSGGTVDAVPGLVPGAHHAIVAPPSTRNPNDA